MITDDDISLVKLLKAEGYSLREIETETGIPKTTVHRILTQRADPEGIDLLCARVEELERLVQSLLPNPKKDSFVIPENLTQEQKLETFRKRQKELAEMREYS